MDTYLSGDENPCLWEWGGGFTNTGECELICNSLGYPKESVCIRHNANSYHALIPIQIGDLVINCSHHAEDFKISVSQVTNITQRITTTKCLYIYKDGGWNIDPPDYLESVLDAAMAKSTDYHCRTVYYAD